jgi:hypothetical protein
MTEGTGGERAVTTGLDLGDRYGCLRFLHTESGELIQEGRLHTSGVRL